jgi:glycosyltransferase involved in cell wall biosynthesis
MSSAHPKFSVLIPTKNGGEYLKSSISSVLSQDYDSYELIVSVNHSSDGTLEYLQSLNHPKLKVIQPAKPCSMTANFENGLSQMSGEWLIIIGDDDALLPHIFSRIDELLIATGPDKVRAISFRRALYFWPGCADLWGGIALSFSKSKSIRVASTWTTLLECIFGFRPYYELPELYTNKVVHSSVIKRIKDLSGGIFYNGIAPDSYSGVAIALLENNFLYVDEPAFLTGTSPKSNGLNNTSQNSLSSTTNKKNIWSGIHRDFYQKSISDGFGEAKSVSLKLWDLADDGPLFILYAMEKVPYFYKKNFVNRLVMRSTQYLVYARLLNSLHNPKSEKQKLIQSALDELMVSNDICNHGIWIAKSLLVIVAGIRLVVKRSHNLYLKFVLSDKKSIHIESYSHSKFPDINSAIRYISENRFN